ncbi:MAG: gfo/Idh/MocA family oxidoreductase, partial [Pirellulales bacterium]
MKQNENSKTSRRGFLHCSASAAVSGTLASQFAFPAIVSGAGGNAALRIGLVGCGGRGTGAAVNALQADPNVELSALGDLFEDNLESSLHLLRKRMPEKIKVP